MPYKKRSHRQRNYAVSAETGTTNHPNRAQVSADEETYNDCLAQADICREQAREAAHLRRFKAACGLFATAHSLCQRAVGLRRGAAPEATERLDQLTIEMQTYSELAKSMERPLLSRAAQGLQNASLSAAKSARVPVA